MKKLKAIKINKSQWFLPALFFALILVSCDDYLDVEPKGIRLLETVDDYNSWLNYDNLQNYLSPKMNMMADNIDNPNIPNLPTNSDDLAYLWRPQFSEDLSGYAYIWTEHYRSILYFNTVLQGIDAAKNGSEQEKKSLKAEALLGRAFDYLCLVNFYGKQYNSNTASNDLAVPFVTSVDISDAMPPRNSVQEIYNHIITDIQAAIPDLPLNNNQNRFRGSVAAAYSVLARTYLYMRDYSKAAQNAQLALDNGPNVIIDYTLLGSDSDIPSLLRRSDAIYGRLNSISFVPEIPSLNFLRSFDIKDLRLKFFYTNLGDYSFTTRGQTQYQKEGLSFGYADNNWGTSVAEMRLIIAEAAARSNNLPTALNQLDIVRKTRFLPADYVQFASTDQETVLQKVLAERTFEFPYNGLRWFDMRRLDAEGRMTKVERYDAGGNVISTLLPGSNKYTLQIPLSVMYFNQSWQQNPID